MVNLIKPTRLFSKVAVIFFSPPVVVGCLLGWANKWKIHFESQRERLQEPPLTLPGAGRETEAQVTQCMRGRARSKESRSLNFQA